MVDETRATSALSQRLAGELMAAKTAAERNASLKDIMDNEQVQHMRDAVDEERLAEKLEGVKENSRIMDLVHISPRAQALYRAQEAKLDGAPERVHERLNGPSEEEKPGPEQSVLGNMDPME
ncbi:hypothetical protein KJ564_05820 [bacterium]|nr:hypothetical protein [bacterium]MBU1880524.1 hypothetical protein [bacterium]